MRRLSSPAAGGALYSEHLRRVRRAPKIPALPAAATYAWSLAALGLIRFRGSYTEA
jgi:hypothetical protein